MVLWKLFVQKAFTALFNGVSPTFPKGFQTALVSHSSHPNQTSRLSLMSLASMYGVQECQGCHASCACIPTEVLKPQDVMNIHNINISSKYCAIWTKIYFRQQNWERTTERESWLL